MLPEIALLNPNCLQEPPFLTDFKGLGSYTIPASTCRSAARSRACPATSSPPTTTCRPRRSRCRSAVRCSGNAQFANINLLAPGEQYGDRINQLDFRVSKILRFGRYRTQIAVDLYNALNSSAIESYNQAFIAGGAWLTPTGILSARFAKITAQLDFYGSQRCAINIFYSWRRSPFS